MNSELKNNQNFVSRISGILNPLTYAVVNIAIIVLLKVTSIEVNIGTLSQGEVIALYNYMSQILIELIKLANLIINISKALACANRVNGILKLKSSLRSDDSKETISKHYIEFKNVYFKYQNAKEYSLSNISFNVNKGDIIGIIGATGSGKTTLINLLPHFYDVSSGYLTIDGKSVESYSIVDLREKIGVASQKSVLFKGTIRSNLLQGNKNATNNDLLEAVELAQATEIINSKENGLDSIVEQNGRNFSGGQKQRLNIARALVRKPEILIFDDTQSALDYATDSKIRTNLKKLEYKPTIFIVSQRTSSIKHANKIIVLDDGKIIGIGTHEKLLKECPVYSEIHYSQFKKEEM